MQNFIKAVCLSLLFTAPSAHSQSLNLSLKMHTNLHSDMLIQVNSAEKKLGVLDNAKYNRVIEELNKASVIQTIEKYDKKLYDFVLQTVRQSIAAKQTPQTAYTNAFAVVTQVVDKAAGIIYTDALLDYYETEVKILNHLYQQDPALCVNTLYPELFSGNEMLLPEGLSTEYNDAQNKILLAAYTNPGSSSDVASPAESQAILGRMLYNIELNIDMLSPQNIKSKADFDEACYTHMELVRAILELEPYESIGILHFVLTME